MSYANCTWACTGALSHYLALELVHFKKRRQCLNQIAHLGMRSSTLPEDFFSSPEPKAPGELIGWQPPSSVVVQSFKLEYLCSLQADLNQILSVACLWWGLLEYAARKIALELCFRTLIGPIGLLWENACEQRSFFIFFFFFFYFVADNNDMHKISHELENGSDQTNSSRFTSP